MIKLGITGGIGSGKSTVSKIFRLLGVPVFDSDSEAKDLYATDSVLKNQLIENFGNESYLPDGTLNRPYLGSIVFNNPAKLNELNKLVHPRVTERFKEWLIQHQTSEIIIKEAAILFESGANIQVDKTLVVAAPLEIRIERVMSRDALARQDVINRIQKQWTQEELLSRADYIVYNSGKESLIKQVLLIHQILLRMAV
jgi:dephospho-CoA kinase